MTDTTTTKASTTQKRVYNRPSNNQLASRPASFRQQPAKVAEIKRTRTGRPNPPRLVKYVTKGSTQTQQQVQQLSPTGPTSTQPQIGTEQLKLVALESLKLSRLSDCNSSQKATNGQSYHNCSIISEQEIMEIGMKKKRNFATDQKVTVLAEGTSSPGSASGLAQAATVASTEDQSTVKSQLTTPRSSSNVIPCLIDDEDDLEFPSIAQEIYRTIDNGSQQTQSHNQIIAYQVLISDDSLRRIGQEDLLYKLLPFAKCESLTAYGIVEFGEDSLYFTFSEKTAAYSFKERLYEMKDNLVVRVSVKVDTSNQSDQMPSIIDEQNEQSQYSYSQSSSRKNSNELQDLYLNEDAAQPSTESKSTRDSSFTDRSKAVDQEMTIKLFHLKKENELRCLSPCSSSFNYEDHQNKKDRITRTSKRKSWYGCFDNWLNFSKLAQQQQSLFHNEVISEEETCAQQHPFEAIGLNYEPSSSLQPQRTQSVGQANDFDLVDQSSKSQAKWEPSNSKIGGTPKATQNSQLTGLSLQAQPFTASASTQSVQTGDQQQKNKTNTSYKIDLALIAQGGDARTTVMIKNIPNKYTQKMLLERLDQGGHRGHYDFLYLPIDLKNNCNVGYAFINLSHPIWVLALHDDLNGRSWERFHSEKICELKYGRIQGKADLVENFSHSVETRKVKPLILNLTPQHDAADSARINQLQAKYNQKYYV